MEPEPSHPFSGSSNSPENKETHLKEALEIIHSNLTGRVKIPPTLPGSPEEQALLKSILDTISLSPSAPARNIRW